MVIAPPHEWEQAIREISELVACGCDIVRIAVPSLADASFLGKIIASVKCPVVADIHFDPLIALSAIQMGVHKIRLNPSNIRDKEMIRKVVLACKERGIPIRVGANLGSLRSYSTPEDAVSKLCLAIQEEVQLLRDLGFLDIVLSAKSSSIPINDAVNRRLSSLYDYPLHLGITEAGPLVPGIVKSTLGLYPLLRDGIGDTIRCSLSGELSAEVQTARTLLMELGLLHGCRIVSCPTCGRAKINVAELANRILRETVGIKEDITVAVMGCEVNGPGEAREATIGIAGSGSYVVLFEKGEIVDKGSSSDMVEQLLKRIGGIR